MAGLILASPARQHLAAKAAASEIPCVLLVRAERTPADPVAMARACGADGIDLPPRWLDSETVRALHEAGLMASAAIANDDLTLARVMAAGADLVDTDRPSIVVAARHQFLIRGSAGAIGK